MLTATAGSRAAPMLALPVLLLTPPNIEFGFAALGRNGRS